MPITINMENCNFYDCASVIRYNYEISQTKQELSQQQQDRDHKELLDALEKLKAAIQENNKTSVKKVVTDFAVQFSSNLFASVAGAALKGLVGGFLL
ncbi:hypothetical protein SDC9_90724 [bioreactor metagenome]|uniref:Uncharacterized protein n=1 Tax=bioreactor metagenome TaxID=1076179 RepID=A0A644ZTH5_9ZZZZ